MLYNEIINVFPELENSYLFSDGTIILQNDSDGTGDYIAVWNYEKPLPKNFKVGK